jgi:hypothetical protein
MGGAKLVGLARRVQRVREKQQAIDKRSIVGRDHGGLPPAVRVPAKKDPVKWAVGRQSSYSCNRTLQTFAILSAGAGKGWAVRTLLAIR